jgi:sugar phosphate isomerase/epimerase
MSKCIVGYSGFVGGNLLLKHKFDYFFNSQNFIDAINLTVDTMYFCGIPAVKWYANTHVDEDTEIIHNIQTILKTMKINKFILISTIDVYNNVNGNFDEDYSCRIDNHAYGKNRFLFEEFVKNTFDNYYIIRLPGLFGYGLKKNILFDLIHNHQIDKISLNTSFQWYSLTWLNDDIETMINHNIRLCNFFTEPITTRDIVKYFNYPETIFKGIQTTTYNLKTKYSILFNCTNGYIRKKEDVHHELIKFIHHENMEKKQLCVSNICTNLISQFQFSQILKVLGFKHVEIAPTKLISWKKMSLLDLSVYTNNEINVYSFQSITFNLPDLNIFNENRNLLLSHIKNVIDLAVNNNVKKIVFGCPKNRRILYDTMDNKKSAVDFFKELGNYCENKNIVVCIEPNSKKYGCNFINTMDEALDLVSEVNSNHIQLMVDLGNIMMENDDLTKVILLKDKLHHIHISQEYLDHFKTPHRTNTIFSNYIHDLLCYDKVITLEMLIKDENELDTLLLSLLNFINIYGTPKSTNLLQNKLYFKQLYW